MANKRSLKKQIRYICGEVAMQCILSREFVEGIDADKMNELVIKTAELQSNALANVTFAYDKMPHDFASRHDYNKSATAYFRAAYKKFYGEFNKNLQGILKELNEALPAEQREKNKQLAQA